MELLPGEKLMSVAILPFDKNNAYSIICKNTDKFQIIKEKFYRDNIEYKDYESEYIFKLKNIPIDPSKTMKENNIEDGNTINLMEEA